MHFYKIYEMPKEREEWRVESDPCPQINSGEALYLLSRCNNHLSTCSKRRIKRTKGG